MSEVIDNLKREVDEMKAAVQTVLDKLAEIRQALADAIAANDPAAIQAAADALDQLQVQIAAAVNPPTP